MAPRNTLLVALVLALVAAALLHLATVLPRLATIKEFSSYSPPEPEPGPKCPADCGGYFLRLDSGGVQEADIVIRGEPKSGTGTSEEWAAAALAAVCVFLRSLYGEQSCEINILDKFHAEMIFEPGRAANTTTPCACTDVERVRVGVNGANKHMLPVPESCPLWRRNDLFGVNHTVCERRDGVPLKNQVDLWKCIQEAGCPIDDDRLQFCVFRDPRAVTVSTYFHVIRNHRKGFEGLASVDDFFQMYLGRISMWVSARYFFFAHMLARQSELFWYADHQADPFEWHVRYLALAGLNLPLDEVMNMVRIATGKNISSVLGYPAKGIDKHPGGLQTRSNRNFRDELSSESLLMMDDVLRTWLPPLILRRLDIPQW